MIKNSQQTKYLQRCKLGISGLGKLCGEDQEDLVDSKLHKSPAAKN